VWWKITTGTYVSGGLTGWQWDHGGKVDEDLLRQLGGSDLLDYDEIKKQSNHLVIFNRSRCGSVVLK